MGSLKKSEILRDLEMIPEDQLNEVKNFVHSVAVKARKRNRMAEPKTLSGIWKNVGFEKVNAIEDEIKSLRKQISKRVLSRRISR